MFQFPEILLNQNNLDEIISNENISDLINKNDSNFDNEEVNKIITFEMDELRNITLQRYNSEFIINGKINKEISQTIMEAKLNLIEAKNLSANCKFIIKELNKSSLNCTININPYKDQKFFSFKTSEILAEEYEIYLSKINEIYIINEGKEEEDDEDEDEDEDEDKDKDKSSKKNNILKFILIGAIVFVILLICTIFIICCLKNKNNINEKENKNINILEKIKNKDNSKESLRYTIH